MHPRDETTTSPRPDEEPPPLLGSWRRLYVAILLHLAFWIVVFYLFTLRFGSPS